METTLARSSGDTDNALRHARDASRLEGEMPNSFGPPFVDFPSAQALVGIARTERARGNHDAEDYAMSLYHQVRATADGMQPQ